MWNKRLLTRREWLSRSSQGFGWLAANSLLKAGTAPQSSPQRATAKQVIMLFMSGGVSQMDSFDPKPRLKKDHGKPFTAPRVATQFDSNGTIYGSPWEFQPGGRSGLPISDLFPHIRKHADELCILRSLTTRSQLHANACFWAHSGSGMLGRPSMGSWVSYGLGNPADNLPSFVVLNGGLFPIGGMDCFKSGFLPAVHEASVFDPSAEPIPNLKPSGEGDQARMLRWLKQQDTAYQNRLGNHAGAIETAIHNYELAAKMQVAVPGIADLSNEPEWLKESYGIHHKNQHTQTYARQCLMARRLVEAGVRFVELTMPAVDKDASWDAHGGLKANHEANALAVDQPIAALLSDLKSRGMLDETLVVFATEFGRTPFAQGSDGRDHNELGFSIWMAGGGVKGGHIVGATDEFGYRATEDIAEIHDYHATLLHLLGWDHEQLTYRFGGRDHRLTDVHGHVIRKMLRNEA